MPGTTEDRSGLDGIITFFGSYHAMRAERVLGAAGMAVELIPGPRDLSPNCGVALAFSFRRREEAAAILQQQGVLFEAIHPYRLPRLPRAAEEPAGQAARTGKLARWWRGT